MTADPAATATTAGPAAADAARRIELCLISHTNAGKTTLARTLLGRDVGEVRDAAHVTQVAESHALLRSPSGDELVLWDTPGFGDSVRLHKRLSMARNPLGWFLTQVWDRWRDPAFHLSQQAMLAARERADLVLYLVNAAEDPAGAGYLDPELKILSWLGKPAIVLLNQTGEPRGAEAEAAEVRRWRTHLAGHVVVKEVIALDAYTRSWVHEAAFFRVIGRWLPEDRRAAHERLLQAWQQRHQERFAQSMQALAAQLIEAARDEQPVAARPSWSMDRLLSRGKPEAASPAEQQAWQQLLARVSSGRMQATRQLLDLHGLQGQADHPFLRQIDAADFEGRGPIDPMKAGVLGAIASGAATGVSADLLSGGLTLGTGALVGALAGALSFAGVALGVNRARGAEVPTVRLTDAALDVLAAQALLKYLAVAHFGRGRGEFRGEEAPAFWQEAVSAAVQGEAPALHAAWSAARDGAAGDQPGTAPPRLADVLARLSVEVFAALYPQAGIRGLVPSGDGPAPDAVQRAGTRDGGQPLSSAS